MKDFSRIAGCVALALSLPLLAGAFEPIIPPAVSSISPAGMQRGTTT